ncbi:MAG: DNA polymerase IV [Gammaproteobacteria bacterium]|nr:DNA polymerase IV [Gammaproteobacteria bacterium]
MTINSKEWPRAFALMDMMSFFASVEQKDFPELAGRPVAVVNGEAGSTIITSSYQARAFGIKTGTKVKEALQACPGLVIRPARSERYAEVSSTIMAALEDITPDLEIFSVDECYLELTHVLSLYDSMEALAEQIRKTVYQASGGLTCSIGISEGKLTAKYCSKLNKGKTTIVPPSAIKNFMAEAPVADICGIGRQIARYLNDQGVYLCKDIEKRPMSILSQRFGNIGKRLYLTCLGHDPEPLATPQEPKSMGHGKVMPPGTKDRNIVIATFSQLNEKLASRLRRHCYLAETLVISMKIDSGWIGRKITLTQATSDSTLLWEFIKEFLETWHSEGVYKVQITATQLRPESIEQLCLFDKPATESKQSKVEALKDQINDKFGSSTLMLANALANRHSFSVISPAWRPTGTRKSL